MQNIKNFTLSIPTKEQLKDLPDGFIPTFLMSEDGQDWYQCQKSFADFTIKVLYDSQGIIRSVVNEPVVSEGGIFAVSMFFPLNMSVAEVESLPEGFKLDGKSWQFIDGKIIPRQYTQRELIEQAIAKKISLLTAAKTQIEPLQDAEDIGDATPSEAILLNAWKKYRIALNRVDTSLAPITEWPTPPL